MSRPTKLSDHYARMRRLLIGASGSQIIIILATPLLTRLYSAEAIGYYAIYMAYLNLIRKFVVLRYDHGIVTAQSGNRAISILCCCLSWISFFVVLILTCILAAFSKEISVITCFLISASTLMVGYQLTFFGLLNHADKQSAISNGRIIESILIVSSQIGLIVLLRLEKNTAEALIFGHIFGILLSILYWGSVLKLKLVVVNSKSIRSVFSISKKIGKRFKRIAFSNMYFGILNVLTNRSPTILISLAYGVASAGLYGLSQRVLSAPANLIGEVSSSAILKSASIEKNGDRVSQLVFRTIIVLFLFGIVPFASVALFGPELFSVVFGSQWGEAGLYAQAAMPFICSSFLINPVLAASVAQRQFDFLMSFSLLKLLSWVVGLIASIVFTLDTVGFLLIGSLLFLVTCLSQAVVYFFVISRTKT